MSADAFAASCCSKAKTFFFAVVARHIWGFAGRCNPGMWSAGRRGRAGRCWWGGRAGIIDVGGREGEEGAVDERGRERKRDGRGSES